jgi:MFS family permease
MGYIGMGATLGTMGGPLLGGVIYENGGYYAVFGLAFGLVGIDIVFRTVMVEKKHPTERLTLTNIFPVQKPTADETTAQGTAATPIAVLHDTHSDVQDGTANSLLYTTPERNLSVHVLSVRDAEENNPLPSTSPQRKSAALTLLSSARMIVVIWVYFVVSVALSSFDSVLPLFVESTFGWTRTGQGLIFLPLSIPFVLDPVVGRINDKYRDARRYLAAGALLSTVPVGVCLRFVFHNSIQDKVLLCILLALLGLCFTFLLPSILVEVSYIVREKEEETPDAFGRGGAMALAYGILNAAFAAGTTVGPFFAGFIRESSGWDTMSWALIILTGASALPVLLCLGGIAWKKRRAES